MRSGFEGPARPPASGPALSVIFVADTGRPSFPAGVEAFLTQTVDAGAFELLVVDWEGGPSYLPLVERARSHARAPRISYLRAPRRGRAALNNLGVSHASAPLLCFCADDFVPGPTYVESHLHYHAAHPEPTRVAIGPGVATSEMRRASPFLAWLEDSGELFGARFDEPSTPLPAGYFYLGNASLKRSLYEKAGPFDERLPFAAYDDLEYGRRLTELGMVSELVPAACCIHDHLITLADRRIQLGQAGVSAALLSTPNMRTDERRWHLLKVHIQTFREWCRSASHDGPRIAWWRLLLALAFLNAYRHQMSSPPPSMSCRTAAPGRPAL